MRTRPQRLHHMYISERVYDILTCRLEAGMAIKDKLIRNLDEDKLHEVQAILGAGTTQAAAINYSLEQVAQAARSRAAAADILDWINEGALDLDTLHPEPPGTATRARRRGTARKGAALHEPAR